MCTLSYKRIPLNWSPWLSKPPNALGYVTTSWRHLHILTFTDSMTRRRTAAIDLKVQQPLQHSHKPAYLVFRHRYLNHSVNHHSQHHYIDTTNPPHHHPSIALPIYDPQPKTPPDPSLEASLFMYHDWVYPNRRLRFPRSTPVQHFHLSIRTLSISIL